MLWVGGHILAANLAKVGFHPLHHAIEWAEELTHNPVLSWITGTAMSCLIGAVIGTGIFVLTAEAAQKAGPGMMLAFIIAGVVFIKLGESRAPVREVVVDEVTAAEDASSGAGPRAAGDAASAELRAVDG